MRRIILGLAVLVTVALIVPLAAIGHDRGGGEALKVKIQLPLSANAPTAGCPAETIFAVAYRISAGGKTGAGRNCIVSFDAVNCAPAACVHVGLLVMLRLPGGTITVRGSLFERAPCDPSSAAECTIVQHAWLGTVTDATGKFGDLVGATVSGGGGAVYKFPPDAVEPFASFHRYVVVIGEEGSDD